MIFVWTMMVLASATECEQAISEETLDGALTAAEEAFANLDDAGFQGKVVEASSLLLPCLSVVPSDATVARYHRTMALHLYGVGEQQGAEAALRAAHRVEPEFSFAGGVLPEDHPLVVYYGGLQDSPAMGKVPEPRTGSVAFDGVAGRERPKGVPTVTQLLDASGVPTWTGYVGPSEPLPSYRAVPRTRNALLGCTGGLVAAAVGTHLGAVATRSQLATNAQDQSLPGEDLDRQRATANTLEGVSVGLALGAAGCGAGAFTVGER